MATRLGEYVVYGELRNRRNYSTHGILVLRGEAEGEETVVRLDLTGNCDPDLEGKTFRFRPGESEEDGPVFRREDFAGFQDRQVGPTATMTAQGWVRALPCGVEEFLQRSKLGEPPPTQWVRRLYLEWYSQNGRVVVEMAGPLLEECTREPGGGEDEGEWSPLPHVADAPPGVLESSAAGPEITLMQTDEGVTRTTTFRSAGAQEADLSLSEDLQKALDREARAIDRSIRGESEDDGIEELGLMDWCIEQGEETPIVSLLHSHDVNALPAVDALDDEAVETQLKVLLGDLALMGIALDVCEHYSPRDCYRLLRESILPEHGVFKELIGTGWVQHVSTWEHCPQCDAEAEAEYERMKKQRPPDSLN